MNDPKLVDPNAKPPEGDNPPEVDENSVEYWQKKYGDGEIVSKLAQTTESQIGCLAQSRLHRERVHSGVVGA